MRWRTVLVEVVVAEPDIDGHMHAVRPGTFLLALAELEQLCAFMRLGHLAAAIVGHVAADDQAERSPDLLPALARLLATPPIWRGQTNALISFSAAICRRRFWSVLPSVWQFGLRPLAMRQAWMSAANRNVASVRGRLALRAADVPSSEAKPKPSVWASIRRRETRVAMPENGVAAGAEQARSVSRCSCG